MLSETLTQNISWNIIGKISYLAALSILWMSYPEAVIIICN